ncbi:MAG: hypothetical protein ACREHG_06310 [Candidatus Saccharimonadales bacterium]
MPRSAKRMTLKQAVKFTSEIQRNFRLTEWKIYVTIESDVLSKYERLGYCSWNTDYKEAYIHLDANQKPKQTKETIIHEMMHILLQGHQDIPARDPMFEFGLNVLCELL